MVLEYLPGGDLFYHNSRFGPFPEELNKFYAAQLVLALSSLHQLGVIYRDLKPENIMLDAKGNLRLVDFGLSKRNKFNATTGCLHLCGTVHYLAPELLNNWEYGHCVDWWALGIVLYELFCKKTSVVF